MDMCGHLWMFLLLFPCMASLIKRPTSINWVACFTDRNGRRLKRSTATKDKKAAQRIAESYETAARRKRTAHQVRKVIASLHKEITGEELPTHSFHQYAESWLERKKHEIADSTLAFYRKALEKFETFIGDKADSEIVEISRDDITRFRNHESKTLAGKTVNHDLKALKMLFRAARRDGVITEDPCEFVDTVRMARGSHRRPFTIDELKSVLAVADDEWRSMIYFGIYTGQRLGDIATLTWQNIDLQTGEIRLVTRKTGRSLIIPIAPPLQKLIMSLPSSDNPSTPVHPRAFDIVTVQGKSGHLSNWFADLLSAAGLREKKKHRKTGEEGVGRGRGSSAGGLSFHCLRHTAVTLLKEAGIPAAVVMEMIGHDSEAMSQHYTHVGREALEKAADSMPDVCGGRIP